MERLMFSILIPVYNCEKYIEKCIRSVADQDYPHKEIIVINDGSKDATPEIARSVASEYTCVTVLDQENQGVSKSRNTALSQASGDYILFLDADDWYEEKALNTIADYLRNDAVDVLYFGYHEVKENSSRDRLWKDVFKEGYGQENKRNIQKVQLNGSSHVQQLWIGLAAWCVCLKHSYLKASGLTMNEELNEFEDILFNICALNTANIVGYINEALYFYNLTNESSVTHIISMKRVQSVLRFLQLLEEYVMQQNSDNDILNECMDIYSLIVYFHLRHHIRKCPKDEFEVYIREMKKSPHIIRLFKRNVPPNLSYCKLLLYPIFWYHKLYFGHTV